MVLVAAVVATLVGAPRAGPAGVGVNIGIDFPAPPPLIPVPTGPVMYAPAAPVNYFFYAGQYYVFTGGVWYASGGYNGPWVAVAPEFVPRPILTVPVRYYRVPPREWRGWRREEAPHWEARWGRGWNEHHAQHHAPRRDERRAEHREK
jgi:hypothetical protein